MKLMTYTLCSVERMLISVSGLSEFPVRISKDIIFNKYYASGSYTTESDFVVSNVFIEKYLVSHYYNL